jgi:twitching motility protein PilT
MLDIHTMLADMVTRGASDLHLKVGNHPYFRIDSVLTPTEYEIVTGEDTQRISNALMTDLRRDKFAAEGEADFAYEYAGVGRFRTNVFRQRGSVGIVMRMVKMQVPGFEELGLPAHLGDIALSERGIILMTGTTSCGKSTTLAAMVDWINQNRKKHIMTIEDPIEYLHRDKNCLINQREVVLDTESFHRALKHVMRQDPDVIVIGEMRDAESFMGALAASDTGHLVFSTLHTTNAAQAVGRILDFFQEHEREQVRLQLSSNLHAVVCQRLVPKAVGIGVIPAVEIMVGSLTVQKMIYENKLDKLSAAIETGVDDGMQTFNQALLRLYNEKTITREAALEHSTNAEALKMNMQGIFLDEARRILAT